MSAPENMHVDDLSLLLAYLRRLFRLSDASTVADINKCIEALDQSLGQQVAYSAELPSSCPKEVSESIDRQLGITPEMLRKWDK